METNKEKMVEGFIASHEAAIDIIRLLENKFGNCDIKEAMANSVTAIMIALNSMIDGIEANNVKGLRAAIIDMLAGMDSDVTNLN